MRALLLFVTPLLFSGVEALGGKAKGHSTFVETIKSVASDSITVKTGRHAGVKSTSIDLHGETTKEAPTNLATYKITQFTNVTVNGLKASVSDLKRGMGVIVTLGTDHEVAGSITATDAAPRDPEAVAGAKAGKKKGKGAQTKIGFQKINADTVLRVDSDSITIAQPGGKRAASYRITPTTTVIVNEKKDSIGAVKAGMDVRVTASDQNVAGTIEASDAHD